MGRHEEALVCYDRAIPLNPAHTTPWDCKGNCLQDLGRRAEAKQCFERVLQLDPSDDEARQKSRDCEESHDPASAKRFDGWLRPPAGANMGPANG